MGLKGRHRFGPEAAANQVAPDEQSECLILVESCRSKRSKLHSIVGRINLLILKFSSKLCKLNFFQEEEEEELREKSSAQLIFNWTNLLVLLILYAIVGLIQALYYHYDYDYYVFHLNRLLKAKRANQSLASVFNCDNTSRLEAYLTHQVASKRRELQRSGSPLISAPTFAAECCYLTWLCYTCIVCFNFLLNLSGGRLKTNFIRLLRSPREEQARLNRWALQEVERFLDSNFNYNNAYLTEENSSGVSINIIENNNHGCSQCSRLKTRKGQLSLGEAQKLELDYCQNGDILRSIMAKGDIIKLYSFTTEWLNQTTLFHCVNFVCVNSFYLTIAIVTVIRLRAENDQLEGSSLMASPSSSSSSSSKRINELLASIQVLTHIFTFTYLGVVLTLMLVIDWKDEIELLARLSNLIGDCVNVNNRIFYQNQTNSHRRDNRLSTDYNRKQWNMNANLLFVLINYKIFPLRARQFLKMQNNGANISLRLMFVFPIIIRLHAPYCEPELLLSLVYVSVCNSLVTTVLMICSSHLNDKTVMLHKPLASLMAHAIQVNDCAKSSTNQAVSVYSEHTVWCLRQELQDLNRFQEQSLPRSSPVNIRFTFPILMRVQFWLNLLTLSIFAQTKVTPSAISTSGYFMSDPLGLLNDKFRLQNWSLPRGQ